MDNLQKQNGFSKEYYEFRKLWDFPRIKENLEKFKNLAKLGLRPEEILKQTLDQSRYNLDFSKQFKYDPSNIFTHEHKHLKRGAKYVFTLDKLLGKFLKEVPKYSIKRLRELFNNNFADFGLMLIFVDFCSRRKIKILEFEPRNPLNPQKKFDFKIKLGEREVLVECFSPIESYINGKNIDDKIIKEIQKHQMCYCNLPIIFVVNLAEPGWSNNFFNRGLISDLMFEPIKFIQKKELRLSQEFMNIGAIIIKYGITAKICLNQTIWNPLFIPEREILTKQSFWARLLNLSH